MRSSIIFSTDMVKAILEGRKTQTRRIIKPRILELLEYAAEIGEITDYINDGIDEGDLNYVLSFCPYQIGQTLWVRETHTFGVCSDTTVDVHYKADEEVIIKQISEEIAEKIWEWVEMKEVIGDGGSNWQPSIFMPRWASRINLKITNIRVERVQDISDEDVLHEGFRMDNTSIFKFGYKGAFQLLWDSINAKRGYGWDINPYVWVLEFIQER